MGQQLPVIFELCCDREEIYDIVGRALRINDVVGADALPPLTVYLPFNGYLSGAKPSTHTNSPVMRA